MNVLIIGLGSIGKKHITALREIDSGVQITALRSGYSTNEIEGVRSITNFREFDGTPDFVIICNPTSEHYVSIKQFSGKGIPLFIEKPALHSLDNLDEIIGLTANQLTYVACNLRFHPGIKWLKENLNAFGRINEVRAYCGSYLPTWRAGVNFRDSYSSRPELGGGVHLDLIHELDYCFYLLGKPNAVERHVSNNSSLAIPAIDYANYFLQYDNFAAAITLNYFRHKTKRELEIVCENATLTLDIFNNTLYINDDLKTKFEVQMADTYVEQLNYFIGCIKQKSKPMNSLPEAADVLKMCLSN